MRPIPLVVLALTLLATLAPVVAGAGQGEVRVAPDVPFWGDLTMTSPRGVVYAATARDGDAFELRAPRVDVAISWMERASDGTSREGVIMRSYSDARVTLVRDSLLVVDYAAGLSSTARSASTGPTRVPWADPGAPAMAAGRADARDFDTLFSGSDTAFPDGWEKPGAWPAPTTPARLSADAVRLVYPERATIQGTVFGHLADGAFQVETSDGRALRFQHSRSQANSNGVTVTNETRVAFRATDAEATVARGVAGVNAFTLSVLYAEDPVVTGTGAFALRHATGTIEVDGKDIALDGEDAIVAGRFVARPAVLFVGGEPDTYSAAMAAWQRDMRNWNGAGPMPVMPIPNDQRGSESEYRVGVTGDIRVITDDGPFGAYGPAFAILSGVGVLAVAGYLWPHLKFLGARAVMPLYTRLARDDIRDNKVRDTILTTIEKEPGVHAIEISRRAKCGWGTVVYHLGVLEKMAYVASVREGRHRRYFPKGEHHHRLHAPLALMKNPATSKVFEAIRVNPGIKQKELSHLLGLAPSTVNWHVGRLQGANLVVKTAAGRAVVYHVSALADEVLRGETAEA